MLPISNQITSASEICIDNLSIGMNTIEQVSHGQLVSFEAHQSGPFVPVGKLYSPFCVTAKVTKLVGLKIKGGLSPINLVTFAVTQNGEKKTHIKLIEKFDGNLKSLVKFGPFRDLVSHVWIRQPKNTISNIIENETL